jgi:YidC/Oxa1 family membrane protein insertase
MDRQSTIGMLLIMGLLLLWMQMNKPSEAQMQRQKHIKDSLAMLQIKTDSIAQQQQVTQPQTVTTQPGNDSLAKQQLAPRFGVFAAAAIGTDKDVVLENDVFKVIFASKGAKIKSVELKKYTKINDTIASKHHSRF